jgi:hypothetical protein
MNTDKYSMDEINIGDGVYFELKFVSNYDLYWTVKSKLDNHTLELTIDEMGAKDHRFIDIKYVKYIEKRT